jgi:uroporphyrinogen decarboxylase
MTRKERVRQAITHHDTDIVPYSMHLTQIAYQRLLDYVKDPDYIANIGDHLTGCGYGGFVEVKPGYFQDDFGVVWNRTVDKDIGVLEGLVLPEADLSNYNFPVIDEADLRARCESAIKNAGDMFVTASLGFSVFERAWTLRGMENVLIDFVTDPDFSHQLFDAICEFNLKVIKIFCEYPFDGIYFGDDWGQQAGTIMGPGHWREFIKPTVAKMYAMAKDSGKFVVQHSCGDIQEIFPDLIDIGLDVYNTFQPEIYDIRAVKKEFGDHLSFYGGISTQRLLPFASPEEVKRVSREIMGVMSKSGGYIASPTHAVPGDVPPENIVAMVDVFHNQ